MWLLLDAPKRFLNFRSGVEIWDPPLTPGWGPRGQKMVKIFFFQIDFFSAESCTLMSISSLTTIFYDVLAFFHEKIEFSAEVVYLAILLIICKKMHTEVPVLQDVEGQNRWHPPKRLGRIGWNFWWKPLRRILSGAPRRFLICCPWAEIWGWAWVPPGGQKWAKFFFQFFDFFRWIQLI